MIFPFETLFMNPKKSFDMYHIWLAPRHILNVPTLIVAVVQYALARHQPVKRKKHVHSSASFLPAHVLSILTVVELDAASRCIT